MKSNTGLLKYFFRLLLLLAARLTLLIIIPLRAEAQSSDMVKENITRMFSDYVKNVRREEVFIQTDREEYVAGEDLWFSVFLTDRVSMLPGADSRIVYFEILNPDNRPVIQKRIALKNGYGPGHAEIPDTLSTGEYLIRAYSSWMKNFLPENCFYKTIHIYNRDISKSFRSSSWSLFTDMGKGKQGNSIPVRMIEMLVDNTQDEYLEVFLKADNEILALTGNRYFLFIQTHGLINFADYQWITSTGLSVRVPKKLLSPGIGQITLFNQAGQPVREAYIYTPLRGTDNQVSISSREKAERRDSLSLNISLQKLLSGTKPPADLCISVSPLTDVKRAISIDDYMIFGSEYGQPVLSALHGQKLSDLGVEALNELLKNLKSNWIDWERILSGKTQRFAYSVEKESFELRGMLQDADRKPAGAGESVLMSIPGKSAVFQYATTDSSGQFSFPLAIDDAVKELILQPGNNTKDYLIIIRSPFADNYPGRNLSSGNQEIKIPDYISDWSASNQVRKIYKISASEEKDIIAAPSKAPLRFYGKPDLEIRMDDYIKLPDMEEVFFEIVDFVSLKKKKNAYEFSIIDPTGLTVFAQSPTSLVDGVILNDPGKIAAIDPELVEKIDVVLRQYIVGDHIFYGIINLITRKGDFSAVSLPGYAIRINFRTTEKVKSFVSPDYKDIESGKSRIPDLRNTLYWNPRPGNSKGYSEVTFRTGDIRSDYIITVQGMTSGGRYFSANRIIRVK